MLEAVESGQIVIDIPVDLRFSMTEVHPIDSVFAEVGFEA
jgi:hypothetical protein